MKYIYSVLLLFLLAVTVFSRPNIVIIMVDDLGAYTCAPYGCDTNLTPNVDSIATDGMRFINMNSKPSCAPSRAALMTGRGSIRTGVKSPTSASNLTTNETTIASVLRDSGYATGVFGKWNLYQTAQEFATQTEQISAHGFDTNITFEGPTIDYGDPSSNETYSPYSYLQGALSFIEDNSANEFFLYYSMGLVHSPHDVPTPLDPDFTGTPTGFHWEKMKYVDFCVSNVLSVIESEGVVSNTVVIFTGDNGTDTIIDSSFEGTVISGGKASADEDGVWVPFYIKWPGQVGAGTTYSGVSKFEDIPVTIAEICRVVMPQDRLIDGRSFYNQILGGSAWRPDEIFMETQFGTQRQAKNQDYKILLDGSVYDLYSLRNRPFGDIEVTSISQVDAINRIQLEYFLGSMTNRSFGDRSWGGSTNEFVLED
jgi:arylsulfatase A